MNKWDILDKLNSIARLTEPEEDLLDLSRSYRRSVTRFEYCKLMLQALGYAVEIKDKDLYLTLPDATAFNFRWENWRQKRPQWPALHLISTEGVLDDQEFINAYLEKKLVLSSGKEFIHDHTVHIIGTILRMHDRLGRGLKCEIQQYNVQVEWRNNLIHFIETNLENKNHHIVALLKTFLSMYIDVTTAYDSDPYPNEIYSLRDLLSLFSGNPNWRSYMDSRYGDLDWRKIFSEIWDQLEDSPSSLGWFEQQKSFLLQKIKNLSEGS